MENSEKKFILPVKTIIVPEDIEKLKKSKFLQEYLEFIQLMSKSVQSKKKNRIINENEFQDCKKRMKPLIDYLQDLNQLVIDTPCEDQPQRFGNKAFRVWLEKAIKLSEEGLWEKLLKGESQDSKIEIREYLKESFGSHQRIDYGTGHELNFVVVLMCLLKIELFEKKEIEYITQCVFYKYIDLMRCIQLKYRLEPAGSHGVWGLDDYHFLPFMFGASELIESEEVPLPVDILQESVQKQYAQDYMYINCIAFINQVKTGHFAHHSPILYDITAASSWTKVSQGLFKMYQAEVLFKFPVIKHLPFGSLISFQPIS